MRILVVADSLGLPRNENGMRVRYESTYPYLLGKKNINYDIVNFSSRSKTIVDAMNELDEVLLYDADCIILQIGIVDCAPRTFLKKEKLIVSKLPSKIRTRFIEFRKKKRENTKTDSLSKVYVRPKDFKKNYLELITRLKRGNVDLKIIIIPIIGYLKGLEMKSKGFSRNIIMYNEILSAIVNETGSSVVQTDLFFDSENYFVDDYYHLSEFGHDVLTQEILKYL